MEGKQKNPRSVDRNYPAERKLNSMCLKIDKSSKLLDLLCTCHETKVHTYIGSRYLAWMLVPVYISDIE